MVVVVSNGVDKRKDLALNIMFVVSVFETRLPPSAAYSKPVLDQLSCFPPSLSPRWPSLLGYRCLVAPSHP